MTRKTGTDSTITLTDEADGLTPDQYLITGDEVPPRYVARIASRPVVVLTNSPAGSVFTFYTALKNLKPSRCPAWPPTC